MSSMHFFVTFFHINYSGFPKEDALKAKLDNWDDQKRFLESRIRKG